MTRIHAIVLAVVAVLAFWAGWEWRDRSADVVVAERDKADAQAGEQAVTQARQTDHATSANTAKVEQRAVQQDAQRDDTFRTIEGEATRYAIDRAADPGDFTVGPDFLRVWNAASAGRLPDPEPGHPARAAAGVPAGTAAP